MIRPSRAKKTRRRIVIFSSVSYILRLMFELVHCLPPPLDTDLSTQHNYILIRFTWLLYFIVVSPDLKLTIDINCNLRCQLLLSNSYLFVYTHSDIVHCIYVQWHKATHVYKVTLTDINKTKYVIRIDQDYHGLHTNLFLPFISTALAVCRLNVRLNKMYNRNFWQISTFHTPKNHTLKYTHDR